MNKNNFQLLLGNACLWVVIACAFFTIQVYASALPNTPGLKAWDSASVIPTSACTKCHAEEKNVWQKTKHFASYGDLHKNSSAKEIAIAFGMKDTDIRKPDSACASCHYTVAGSGSGKKIDQGVSCQSCHGPAANWKDIHNEYGGDDIDKESEAADHKVKRMKDVKSAGMVASGDLLAFAQNCYQCHLVTNEDLLNKTTHPGPSDFDFLARTQGNILHSEAANSDKSNKLIIAGAMAQVIGSLNALGSSTDNQGRYAELMKAKASTAISTLSDAANKTQNKELLQIEGKLKNIELTAGNASLVQLAKSIYNIATGALDEDGSLTTKVIKASIVKPKTVIEKIDTPAQTQTQTPAPTPAVKTEDKKIEAPKVRTQETVRPVENIKSSVAATAIDAPKVEEIPLPQELPLFAGSVALIKENAALTTLKSFSLIMPVNPSGCVVSNPWSLGWLTVNDAGQTRHCFGMAYEVEQESYVVILAIDDGKVINTMTTETDCQSSFVNTKNYLLAPADFTIVPFHKESHQSYVLQNQFNLDAIVMMTFNADIKDKVDVLLSGIPNFCTYRNQSENNNNSPAALQDFLQAHSDRVDWMSLKL